MRPFLRPNANVPRLLTSTSSRGFSLVEMSVVMVIISIVAVMGLELVASYMNRTAYQVTVDKITRIDQAIADFKRVNGRLPCPSDRSYVPTDSTYGKETRNAGTYACLAGALSGFADIRFGSVPARALNLPTSYMTDGYGTQFTYVMMRDMGKTSGETGSTVTPNFNNVDANIQVRAGKIDTTCGGVGNLCQDKGNAAYLVFSYGKDRRGGYTKNSTSTNSCVVASDSSTDGKIDAVNCRLSAGGFVLKINGSTTTVPLANNIFYDSRYNAGTQEESYFDDIVKWRSKADLL